MNFEDFGDVFKQFGDGVGKQHIGPLVVVVGPLQGQLQRLVRLLW